MCAFLVLSCLSLCISWPYISTSFTRLGNFFIIFSNGLSISCSFSSPSNTPHDTNVRTFEVVPEAPSAILSFWIPFSSYCSDWVFLFIYLFCFLIFQITDLIFGFIYSTVNRIDLLYGKMHLWLDLSYAVEVLTKLIEHSYNQSFEVWI